MAIAAQADQRRNTVLILPGPAYRNFRLQLTADVDARTGQLGADAGLHQKFFGADANFRRGDFLLQQFQIRLDIQRQIAEIQQHLRVGDFPQFPPAGDAASRAGLLPAEHFEHVDIRFGQHLQRRVLFGYRIILNEQAAGAGHPASDLGEIENLENRNARIHGHCHFQAVRIPKIRPYRHVDAAVRLVAAVYHLHAGH